MKYKILKLDTHFEEEFEKLVNEYLEKGWRPSGGLIIRSDKVTAANYFYQAIIKD